MKIYSSIEAFQNVKKPIVTTGTFDGVHFGHRKIIDRLSEVARKCDGETVLLTFSPHPRMVLFPDDHGLKLLNSLDEKKRYLEEAGIQHLIVHPFTKEFSRITSINFVRDVLVNQLNTHKLVIGYNHHFGRNREGSFEHLKEFAPVYGFEVEEIPVQLLDDVGVSSTKIRKALFAGDVRTATDYLGYEYELKGVVVRGNALGRTIGFPTANLQLSDTNKLVPADGVYAVRVEVKGDWYDGMMNIGVKPTLKNQARTLEVHLLNFGQDIYREEICIKFVERIRDEIAFNDINQLSQQLEQDRFSASKILIG
ncbi:MAG: bifunctional riboflavin kinase/FAD synthetase [Rhodobacteraceae bacterium]|nr:bifunctional riboflavin kinase/FAD synthetase [Paracoccaceae bacterium]